jgi:hypothetical protein
MSGTKHLKPGLPGGDTVRRKKKEKGKTDPRDPRGIPTLVMGPTGKTRMEWR